MSKAPSGNVQEYEGDGEWFKIWETTICDESGDLTTDAWCAYGLSQFEFQIPEDTPAGEYLVRAEHVGLHGAQDNEAEFFYRSVIHLNIRLSVLCFNFLYSCAQINVSGSGSGSPDTTYSIPGLYDDSMTLFNGLNIWTDSVDTVKSDIAGTPIGDKVWSGASSGDASVPSSSISASATPASSEKFTCGK